MSEVVAWDDEGVGWAVMVGFGRRVDGGWTSRLRSPLLMDVLWRCVMSIGLFPP